MGRSTLADELDVAGADEDELYAALDWLAERQEGIEARLARRHLKAGELTCCSPRGWTVSCRCEPRH